MTLHERVRKLGTIAVVGITATAWTGAHAQAPTADQAAVIQRIDAAVMARVNGIAGYTVTEHYSVFRADDKTNAVADMTVKTTYTKNGGKSYEVVQQGGSAMIRRLGLDPILQSEKDINQPSKVAQSWIDSANYDMTLKPGAVTVNGRDCLQVLIHPKRKAPNLIEGTIWVDAKDFTLVRLEGVASKAPSIFAGEAHVTRDYAEVNGFAMAIHARAETSTFVYGKTVITIDYMNYDIQPHPHS